MKYKVDVQLAVKDKTIPKKAQLQNWASLVLQHLNSAKATVCLRVTSIEEMQALNLQYRQQDKPTNVLSFPADLPEGVRMAYPLLGDIILCADIIKNEANQQHKTLEAHWAHMVIHGVLHLLGYDHIIEQDAVIMEAIEIEILASLHYPNPYFINSEALHD